MTEATVLEKNIGELQDKIRRAEQRRAELGDVVDQATGAISAYERQLEEALIEKTDRLKAELAQAEKSLKAAEKRRAKLKEDIADVRQKRDAAEAAVDKARTDLISAQSAYRSAAKAERRIEEQIADLRRQLAEAEAEAI